MCFLEVHGFFHVRLAYTFVCIELKRDFSGRTTDGHTDTKRENVTCILEVHGFFDLKIGVHTGVHQPLCGGQN